MLPKDFAVQDVILGDTVLCGKNQYVLLDAAKN